MKDLEDAIDAIHCALIELYVNVKVRSEDEVSLNLNADLKREGIDRERKRKP